LELLQQCTKPQQGQHEALQEYKSTGIPTNQVSRENCSRSYIPLLSRQYLDGPATTALKSHTMVDHHALIMSKSFYQVISIESQWLLRLSDSSVMFSPAIASIKRQQRSPMISSASYLRLGKAWQRPLAIWLIQQGPVNVAL